MTVKSHDTADREILFEIRSDVERLFNRHMEAPRLWYPHEQIAWSEGEDFQESPWSPEQYVTSDGVRSAIYVNLLTEDNLPYYTSTILEFAPKDHPIREWSLQWTAEENRHAMVMRDWVHISRCIDPVLLEDGRRIQMTSGEYPVPDSFSDLISYVAFQERATQVAHRNTASHLPKEDRVGRNVLGLVAGDETKHYMFYRDLVAAALLIDPSTIVQSLERQIVRFAMPGTGIPRFTRHAVRIAREGIYGLPQFLQDVVEPILENWRVSTLEGLNAEAEAARERLFASLDVLRATVERASQRASGVTGALA
ncbi:MAG: acyl-ACP desaturase [Acidimicrobiaceae bacterium]|nr:acyl-ACP desaturase [Acidimicrobiaceae bacterium]